MFIPRSGPHLQPGAFPSLSLPLDFSEEHIQNVSLEAFVLFKDCQAGAEREPVVEIRSSVTAQYHDLVPGKSLLHGTFQELRTVYLGHLPVQDTKVHGRIEGGEGLFGIVESCDIKSGIMLTHIPEEKL